MTCYFVQPSWDFVQMAGNCLEGTREIEYLCTVTTLSILFEKRSY